MNVLGQRGTEHAVESINADLGIGPVFDVLLTGIGHHNLLGRPVQPIGQQENAAQTI